jgi:hypothetical protein
MGFVNFRSIHLAQSRACRVLNTLMSCSLWEIKHSEWQTHHKYSILTLAEGRPRRPEVGSSDRNRNSVREDAAIPSLAFLFTPKTSISARASSRKEIVPWVVLSSHHKHPLLSSATRLVLEDFESLKIEHIILIGFRYRTERTTIGIKGEWRMRTKLEMHCTISLSLPSERFPRAAPQFSPDSSLRHT